MGRNGLCTKCTLMHLVWQAGEHAVCFRFNSCLRIFHVGHWPIWLTKLAFACPSRWGKFHGLLPRANFASIHAIVLLPGFGTLRAVQPVIDGE